MDALRGRRSDDGFTLIELMVVVLIIAILLAIAIPTFLGARTKANDRAVQQNVRNAFVATRIYYNGAQQYTADPASMAPIEPSIHWSNTLPDGTEPPATVYIEVQDVPTTAQSVVVVGRSKSGKCFMVRDVMSGATAGTHFNNVAPAGSPCTVPAANDPSWGDAWSQ